MIKKKMNEDLRAKNIEFEMDNLKYKVLRFYHTAMNIDVILVDDKNGEGIKNFGFAQLPKSLKKILKPN